MLNHEFDPTVWGPHYWFFLHTIARAYPTSPSRIMQKKYYTFYQDLPLFIPGQSMGNAFAALLDKYPVNPYLSSRSDLVKWTNFVHNKINIKLYKEEIPFDKSTYLYWSTYNKAQPRKYSPKVYYAAMLFTVVLGIAVNSHDPFKFRA